MERYLGVFYAGIFPPAADQSEAEAPVIVLRTCCQLRVAPPFCPSEEGGPEERKQAISELQAVVDGLPENEGQLLSQKISD